MPIAPNTERKLLRSSPRPNLGAPYRRHATLLPCIQIAQTLSGRFARWRMRVRLVFALIPMGRDVSVPVDCAAAAAQLFEKYPSTLMNKTLASSKPARGSGLRPAPDDR